MSETNESTIALVASEWLKAQTNNNLIYKWMKDYGIGESEYGKLLDAMAKGKGVFYHFPSTGLEKHTFGPHPYVRKGDERIRSRRDHRLSSHDHAGIDL